MSKVLIDQEAVEQVIEKAEAAIKHFNIERIGESTYKDTNTRCELHEAVNKLRAALEQPGVEPAKPASEADMQVYRNISARYFKDAAPQPAQQPAPRYEPTDEGIGND